MESNLDDDDGDDDSFAVSGHHENKGTSQEEDVVGRHMHLNASAVLGYLFGGWEGPESAQESAANLGSVIRYQQQPQSWQQSQPQSQSTPSSSSSSSSLSPSSAAAVLSTHHRRRSPQHKFQRVSEAPWVVSLRPDLYRLFIDRKQGPEVEIDRELSACQTNRLYVSFI